MFINAYHGNTQSALSLMGQIIPKRTFFPLLTDVRFIRFNEEEDLDKITEKNCLRSFGKHIGISAICFTRKILP